MSLTPVGQSVAVGDPAAAGYPASVTRRWSDALAGAGLFGPALIVYPQEEADLFRRAELAVLAQDPGSALQLLKEYDDTRDEGQPAEPAVVLLLAVARTQAGEATGWQEVTAAAQTQPGLLWTSWMVALAGLIGPQLPTAGPAAERALRGGCRDPRLPVIAAAAQIVDGDELTWQQCAEAVRLLEEARAVQLPGEDVVASTLDLLSRAGSDDRAANLAAYAVADEKVPREAQEAWREAAKQRAIVVPRGRWLGLLPDRAAREQRQLMRELRRDLTCRCHGSTGWAGPERLNYVGKHLHEVDAQPVPGLAARLLSCRATGVRFLDLTQEQLTLPVDFLR
jgi:hypothetical protein